eukprot:1143627-Pelagomonas_calceolata.AAC.1
MQALHQYPYPFGCKQWLRKRLRLCISCRKRPGHGFEAQASLITWALLGNPCSVSGEQRLRRRSGVFASAVAGSPVSEVGHHSTPLT